MCTGFHASTYLIELGNDYDHPPAKQDDNVRVFADNILEQDKKESHVLTVTKKALTWLNKSVEKPNSPRGYYLSGLAVWIDAGIICSTDGHRLHLHSFIGESPEAIPNQKPDYLIASEHVKLLIKTMNKKTEHITVQYGTSSGATYRADNANVTILTTSDNNATSYPDVLRVIPKVNNKDLFLTFYTDSLKPLKAIKPYINPKFGGVRFVALSERLEVSNDTYDLTTHNAIAKNHRQDDVGYNWHYVCDALAMPSNKGSLDLYSTSNNNSGLIVCDDYAVVLMPMRL